MAPPRCRSPSLGWACLLTGCRGLAGRFDSDSDWDWARERAIGWRRTSSPDWRQMRKQAASFSMMTLDEASAETMAAGWCDTCQPDRTAAGRAARHHHSQRPATSRRRRRYMPPSCYAARVLIRTSRSNRAERANVNERACWLAIRLDPAPM